MTAAVVDMDRSFRAKILDVREQRKLAAPLEYRTDTSTGQVILEGYAATFSPYDVYGGAASGGWVETIHSRAFDETLATSPDVQLLLNHEGLPLARTKSGTLSLRADQHGLFVRATLDPSDPDVQRLMPKMRRGDMDEMSFAFRVRDQVWDSSYTQRSITNVNLEKGDVSVVNYGMNPNTAAMLSSADAISALAKLANTDLLELRSMDRDQVRRALAVLQRASTPKSYKGVSNFADPGYKDSAGNPAKGGNGVKRYPLNSATRVQAAWRYISMPKNRKGYTSEQLSAIEGKIKAAAKKFGVEISDSDDAKSARAVRCIEATANAAGGTHLVAVLGDGSRVPVRAADVRGDADYLSLDPGDPKETHAMEPDEHGHDEHAVDCDDEMEFDARGDGSDDEEPGDEEDRADAPVDEERILDLAQVVALEHTIVTCYNMASEDAGMRAMLARARRQVRDLQGVPEKQVDVTRKLEELRAEFGDPKTVTVSEGLRAISQLGFTDTVRLKD